MWAVARYDFRLTDREFGELTLPQFWELWKRRSVEFRRNCYLHGITASAVYNVHRTEQKQHIFSPFDFSVPKSAEEEQRDEIIATLKKTSVPVLLQHPDRIPELKQNYINKLTEQGIRDPEEIVKEVFGDN